MRILGRYAALLTALTAFTTFTAAPANAQPFGPSGGQFRVNTTTSGGQFAPTVGVDLFGQFFIAWQSADGDGDGIFGRRFQHSGAPVDPLEFRITAGTTGDQVHASVAGSSLGAFVAVWEKHPANLDNNVFGQLYDGSGEVGSVFQVNTATSGGYLGPRVAMDSAASFVAVWNHNGDIKGQRYNSSGGPLGGEMTVATSVGGTLPAVARAGTGDFVVVWGQTSAFLDARLYDSAGTPKGAAFQVNTLTSGPVRNQAVAMTSVGFVVTWDYEVSDKNIKGRLFDAEGTPQTGEFRVNSYTTGDQLGSAVAMDALGGFVVVWDDRADRDGGGSADAGVYARRYDSTGSALGGDFRVNATTTSNQLNPAIAMQANGDFVVSWYGYGGGTGGDDIYAQRYCHALAGDADGNGTIDVLDLFHLINTLFAGGPPSVKNADANGDGTTDVLDVFYLVNYLFAAGPAPSCPAPLI